MTRDFKVLFEERVSILDAINWRNNGEDATLRETLTQNITEAAEAKNIVLPGGYWIDISLQPREVEDIIDSSGNLVAVKFNARDPWEFLVRIYG